jgi:hypothetical protein
MNVVPTEMFESWFDHSMWKDICFMSSFTPALLVAIVECGLCVAIETPEYFASNSVHFFCSSQSNAMASNNKKCI